jgi:hypothetical protein
MTRGNMLTRIGRLEGVAVLPQPKWHQVIGDSAEECEAQRLALIDSEAAEELDSFIFRILVGPEPRTDILSLSAQEGDLANELH